MKKAIFQRRYHLLTLVCGIVLGGLGLISELRAQGGWADGFGGWPLPWYWYSDVRPTEHNWLAFAVDVIAASAVTQNRPMTVTSKPANDR